MAIPMRARVVAMTVMLAGVTYLDRVAIGVVAPQIRKDLGLSLEEMSYVFSAFTVAYAVFEIPTAAWADRIGCRGVIARIVAWWSAFTVATAAAWSYASLLVIRFLFGIGEAGAWPCVGRVFSRWIPAGERGKAQGVFFSGAFIAGALTPKLVGWLSGQMPWRWVFVVFGLVGFVWAAMWWWWFRDEPRDKEGTSREEVDKIERERGMIRAGHGDWKAAFGVPIVIPICLIHFANSWGTYFVITWLPTYLIEIRGMTKGEMEVFAGLPMFIAALASLCGGMATDYVAKRMGLVWGRAGVAGSAYCVSMTAMYFAANAPEAQTAASLIALSYGSSMFTLGAAFSLCIEFGKENSAVMTATMNTAGQVGGFLSPIVLAKLVTAYGDWNLPLYVMVGLYGMAVLNWVIIGRQVRDTIGDGKH
ncbi:MAG: MFS transporter [Bryobacter sp.]|jgi:MFS family permease|nr:MFS transporter [Bryobacter sp. CoA8 C33]